MASELGSVDLGTSGPVDLDQLHFDLSEPSEDLLSGLDHNASNEDGEEVSALSDLLTVDAVTFQNPEPLVAEGKGHGDLGEVEGQTQQKYQSPPDIVKSTLYSKYENISVGGKDAENLPNPVNMGNYKMPEIAKVHMVESQTTKFSVNESIQSLSDVMFASDSVPENVDLLDTVGEASKPSTEDEQNQSSGSEFDVEFSHQGNFSQLQQDSESDSEFEVPDRPPEKTKVTLPGNEVVLDQSKMVVTGSPTNAVVKPTPAEGAPVKVSSVSHQFPKATIAFSTTASMKEAPVPQPILSLSKNDSSPKHEVIPPMASSGLPSFSSRGHGVGSSAGSGDANEEITTEENKIQRSPEVQKSDDWENIATIQAEFASDKTESKETSIPAVSAPLLKVQDVIDHFQQADMSAVKPKIHSSIERHGFSAFSHFLFGPPKMHQTLLSERELIFCIAGSQLDNDNKIHIQTLQSIYRILTGSRFDCQRYGSHWEEIGFQGRDPGTDVRGVGMLGLVQLLHLLRNPATAQLGRDVYKLSLHPTQNFPFCVMGINLSRICIQALREDVMNKECNRRRQVFQVVNDFYVGAFLHLYLIWRQGKTISDSGYVIKEVETFAKKKSKSLLKNMEEYLKKKPSTADVTVEDGIDDFLSVCKVEVDES